MERLVVALDSRSYPISIGPGLLRQTELFSSVISGRRVMVVTNDTVAPLYLELLKQTLSGFQLDVHVVPDGETYKSLASFEAIMSSLLEGSHGRDTTLVALGGGHRRSDRLCGGLLPAWRSFCSGAHYLAVSGGFLCGWQNCGKPPVGQEHDWGLLPAKVCGDRHRLPGHPAGQGVVGRAG